MLKRGQWEEPQVLTVYCHFSTEKTQTRNRETDIKFIVIPTTDHEDMVTYSTLVHNTEATQREVNKPTTDREDMVTYSTLVHKTPAGQSEVNK
ncbi:hypothetical protein GN956_G26952, partial [Arapaima gigas]